MYLWHAAAHRIPWSATKGTTSRERPSAVTRTSIGRYKIVKHRPRGQAIRTPNRVSARSLTWVTVIARDPDRLDDGLRQ